LQALGSSSGGEVVLWDAQTGDVLGRLEDLEGAVLRVEFSPDGSADLWFSDDNIVIRQTVGTGEKQTLLEHSGQVERVAVDSSGQWVAVVASDGRTSNWNLLTGEQLPPLTHLKLPTGAIAISAGGRHVLVALDDWTSRLWDMESGREVARLLGHGAGVRQVAFTPQGGRAVTLSYDGTLRAWDLADMIGGDTP